MPRRAVPSQPPSLFGRSAMAEPAEEDDKACPRPEAERPGSSTSKAIGALKDGYGWRLTLCPERVAETGISSNASVGKDSRRGELAGMRGVQRSRRRRREIKRTSSRRQGRTRVRKSLSARHREGTAPQDFLRLRRMPSLHGRYTLEIWKRARKCKAARPSLPGRDSDTAAAPGSPGDHARSSTHPRRRAGEIRPAREHSQAASFSRRRVPQVASADLRGDGDDRSELDHGFSFTELGNFFAERPRGRGT